MDSRLIVVRPVKLDDGTRGREVFGFCVHCKLSHRKFQVPAIGDGWVEAGLCVESDERPVEQVVGEFKRGTLRSITSVARRYSKPRRILVDGDQFIDLDSQLNPNPMADNFVG